MPLWLSYFFIWILILSGAIINSGLSEPSLQTQSCVANLDTLIREVARGGVAVISLGFMILSAVLVFSFMNNESSTVFVSSLPVRRESAFWTSAASGIVPIIFANILIFLLMLLLSLSMGLKITGALLYWLKVSSLISLGYYGIALVCCNVSGSAMASIIIYAILNFAAVIVQVACNFAAQLFLLGFVPEALPTAFLTKFSPPVWLVIRPLFGVQDRSISPELYITVFSLVSLALIFISSIFYKERKMETAGEFISQSWLRPVFKICLSLGSALVLGGILYSIFFGSLEGDANSLLFMLCALISAAAGYYVGEALLERKLDCFKNKKSNLIFAAVSLVVIVSVLILSFDIFGYEKRVPEAENVSSLSFTARGPEIQDCENAEIIEEAVKLHRLLTESEAGSSEDEKQVLFVNISYELKDGSKLTREYKFHYYPDGSYEDLPEALKATERFINLKPVVLERLKLDFTNMQETYAYIDLDYADDMEKEEQDAKELSMKHFRDLYENAVMKDAENGNIGHKSLVVDKNALENYYDCSVRVSYLMSEKDEDGDDTYVRYYKYLSIRPEIDSEYTLSWLKEQGVEPTICAERKNWENIYSNWYDFLLWEN